MQKFLILIGLAPAILAPALLASPSLAGVPVGLRSAPIAYNGAVTLGDLFDGADGPAHAVVVARDAPGGQAVLDSADVQRAAHAAGLEWDNASGLRRVIVSMAAGPAPAQGSSAERRVRHGRTAQVLVYTRNMMSGDVVGPADLAWSGEAIAGGDAPHDPDAVIGKVARGPLREGAAVAAHDLMNAKVVRRGDMISVDFNSDGMSLSLMARALGDAAAGEAVEAMNLTSKKVIDAVATQPGHAAVGPGADAARAAAGQFASLR